MTLCQAAGRLTLCAVTSATLIGLPAHAQLAESQQATAALDPHRVAEAILEQTNAFRAGRSAPPLSVDEQLRDAALYFADYMATTDAYGHTADGKEPAERAAEHGYRYCIVAENIAYSYREAGFDDENALAEELVQNWIDSPDHRRNLEDGDLFEIGIGVAQSEETHRFYAVQKFGRPADDAIEFSIANESGRAFGYRLGTERFHLAPAETRLHTVCRPPEIELDLPRRERRGREALRPDDGDRFVAIEANGRLRVERQ